MAIEARYLEAFHAVCRTGSISSAADALGVTQPAVSYQIRMLERQAGAPLFQRLGRNIVLTPDGRRLRDFCLRFFPELLEISAAIQGGTPAEEEPLRIASVSVFGRYVLFPILCREEFRHLRLELQYRTASEVFDLLRSGEVDVGAVYEGRVSSHFDPIGFYTEEIVLITGPDDSADYERLKDLEFLASCRFITYEEGDFVFGRWFTNVFGAQPSNILSAHHFQELEEVVEMVALKRGVSIVPIAAVAQASERERVRIVRPGGKTCLNREQLLLRNGSFVRSELHLLTEALRVASVAEAL